MTGCFQRCSGRPRSKTNPPPGLNSGDTIAVVMANTGKIHADFSVLKQKYPTYNKLPSDVFKFMMELNDGKKDHWTNTPCCVQVSHALNQAALKIPQQGYRRKHSQISGDY